MLSEFRDLLYTVAWFGLMTSVWFGWAQESPAPRARVPLIVGSVIGVAIAIGFGILTGLNWDQATALEGRYGTFGVIVGAEVVLAGAGAAVLAAAGQPRWMAWWIAVVVAAHFVSLAWLLDGVSLAVLGALQLVALAIGAGLARDGEVPTSRWVGPLMGVSILTYAIVGAVVALRHLPAA